MLRSLQTQHVAAELLEIVSRTLKEMKQFRWQFTSKHIALNKLTPQFEELLSIQFQSIPAIRSEMLKTQIYKYFLIVSKFPNASANASIAN